MAGKIKIKDGKLYIKVGSAKPGEEYTIQYLDGTKIKKKIEVFEKAPEQGV
jgi:hypothetical protein